VVSSSTVTFVHDFLEIDRIVREFKQGDTQTQTDTHTHTHTHARTYSGGTKSANSVCLRNEICLKENSECNRIYKGDSQGNTNSETIQ